MLNGGKDSAPDGYAFFGLNRANRRYENMSPSDSYLDDRFREVLPARTDEFVPIIEH